MSDEFSMFKKLDSVIFSLIFFYWLLRRIDVT